jgi:glycosyltransferase involved in cell wall biosynthesis
MMGSSVNRYLCEKFVPAADALTVSNTFLRARFGGELVYHGRDTDAYDPKRLDPESIRERHNIAESDKIVMFIGTPRRYKGLEVLVKSIRLIQDTNVKLFLVGTDMTDGYSVELAKMATDLLGPRFVGIEAQDFTSIPAWLSIADVIVIPQKRNVASLGQMPAKVFDAMAMAKPIVATNVNDLSKVLLNCGWIVEPNDLNQLSTTIRYILNHPDEAKKMGNQAREECIRKYSLDALEPILQRKFQTYESG